MEVCAELVLQRIANPWSVKNRHVGSSPTSSANYRNDKGKILCKAHYK